ncbi:SNRPA1 [Cordylochernes scorpioides]|uniref:SNRPA1 n=1 Tax=Cordylochernes scorpioides TaxID=51811 RepID=A0ABY6LMN9_9ARAC|nr:SNRPA1 [Cordylochernes scorpioides]
MVKLTPDLIEQSAQYTNPIKDRELDLRGYKIPTIENLGATLDQFDVIDFSDNDIRKLDGFPLLKRLSCLLLNNNRICRIGENLQESLPNLQVIILTNNNLQELGDIDPLVSVKTLTHLSLMKNSICTKKNYRLYVIHKLPQVLCLDFRKVKMKEREAAAQLFKGKKGKQLEKELSKKSKTFVPGGPTGDTNSTAGRPSAADVEAIKAAISKAKTLEEVERLNQMLKSGQFHVVRSKGDEAPAVEEDEDGEPMEVESK